MTASTHTSSTIVAPATPMLPSPRAVVRLSGPRAAEIALRVLSVDPADAGAGTLGRRARMKGWLVLPDGRCPAEAWSFPAPASATGEHVIELHLPGAPALVRQLVDALVEAGAQVAEAGEFTRRAFAAGKLDLAQAEAVMAMVSSAGASGARQAHQVLQGQVSRQLDAIIHELEHLCATFEVSFDFDEEAAEQADQERFGAQARAALQALSNFAGPARSSGGELVHVVLAGPANAGKSTLFNALAQDQRSAVSPQAGATRDLVRARIDCAGLPVELIDSAGLKPEADAIETAALERTRQAAGRADLVLWLLSSNGGGVEALADTLAFGVQADPGLRQRSLLIRTKLDLQPRPALLPELLASLDGMGICAPRGEGLPELRAAIAAHLRHLSAPEAPAVSARAWALLQEAREALGEAVEALELGVGLEVVSSLARAALSSLRDMSGRGPSADVLDTVFGNFCIGK